MPVYGAFEPGSFNAWTLNLFSNVFVSAGVARGMLVTAPGGMQVNVTMDATANDGVCYLPNGCFLRIDSTQSFAVPNNTTGNTRTDAVVAFVDPTGVTVPSVSLTYVTNWASGFTPGNNNQLVLALVSVGSGVVAISSGNITNTSAQAKITGTSGSSSMVASDGVGLSVQDNSSTAILSVVLTGLTTGLGRSITMQTTDVSAIGHQFNFGADGNFYMPNGAGASAILYDVHKLDLNRVPFGSETTDQQLFYVVPVNASIVDMHLQSRNGGSLYLDLTNASARFDPTGLYSGATTFLSVSGANQRIFTGTVQPTNATNGDIWINV